MWITCMFLLLVTAFPTSAQVITDAPLAYALTFTPAPGSSPRTGAVVGRFGGVPVSGTYQGTSVMGILTLNVGEALFASGSYSCSSTCIFAGSIAGKAIMGLSALALQSNISGTGSAMSRAFPTFGVWIAAVRDWANANLSGEKKKEVVSAVIKEGEDSPTLNDPSNNHGQNQTTGGRTGSGPSGEGTGSGTSAGGTGSGASAGGTGSGTSGGGMGGGTSGGGMGGGKKH